VGIDTLRSSVPPPLDEQLVAPLDDVGEADELGTLLDELGEADELNDGEFEARLEETGAGPHVGPQAVAARITNATTAARSILVQTSQEGDWVHSLMPFPYSVNPPATAPRV
jgi:hypothetical protein